MPKSPIYLKTDAKLKAGAQKKADELGLSLSAIINILLREFVLGRDLYIQNDEKDPEQRTEPKPPIRLA